MADPYNHAAVRMREEIAIDMRVKGATYKEIAKEIEDKGLGPISPQSVCDAVKRVEKRAFAEMNETLGNHKAFQIIALMNLYREGMKALEQNKSLRDDEGNTEFLEAYVDPKFSAEVRAVLADIRKLGGLDAPQKFAPTTPEGDKPYKAEVDLLHARLDMLSVEELKQLHAMTKKWEAANELGAESSNPREISDGAISRINGNIEAGEGRDSPDPGTGQNPAPSDGVQDDRGTGGQDQG